MPTLRRKKQIIRRAAHKYGIDPSILYGVWGAETNFGHNKNRSSAGAEGDFQFMPSTAASLGINPYNFKQAAFGAARYLSQYKDRGVDGMLAAYNAGPAGNPNNPETRAYVPRVKQLAQGWQGGGGGGGGPMSGGGGGPSYRTVPGVDNSAARQQLQLQYLQTSHDPNALLNLAYGLQGAQDTPSSRVRIRQSGGNGNRSGGGGGGGRYGTLYELFWQGAGGIDVKNGSHVPQGFVAGHTDHVHVAARQNDLLKLGRLAQRMGLHVGENPAFGGVNPVHVHDSYHYGRTRGREHDRAIDVSGDPALMRKFAHRVARLYGI